MKFLGALIGALVAGIVGAAIWAGIVIGANLEIGWVAWGIGALVGFGTSVGSRGGGVPPAMIAALVTILSIAGGKYAAVKYQVMQVAVEAENEFAVSDDAAISSLIEQMPPEDAANFRAVPPVDPAKLQDDDISNDYPFKVWEWGTKKWAEMTPDQQENFKAEEKERIQALLNQFRQQVEQEGFLASWGPMDLLFLALGVITAFQIAMNDPIHE